MTLFPEIIYGGLCSSIIRRAIDNRIISLNCINIRDFSTDKHHRVDDSPYGGGAGMVIQPHPVYAAYTHAKKSASNCRVVYLTPQGCPFNQKMAFDFSNEENIILLCGHYEGIDERIIEEIVTDEVSIGDYVITGGELAAMVVIDAVSRLIPGVLGKSESFTEESFSTGLLEYPQYTRPPVFLGRSVPDVLLSGHHKNIEKWRMQQSITRTINRRSELIESSFIDNKLLKKDLLINKELKKKLKGWDFMNYKLNIEGMSCGHCAQHVTKALNAIDGATNVKVELENKCAFVSFNNAISEDILKTAIDDAGYDLVGVATLV